MNSQDFTTALATAIREDGMLFRPVYGEPCQGLPGLIHTCVFNSDYELRTGDVVTGGDGNPYLILSAEGCGKFVLAHLARLPEGYQQPTEPDA